MLSRQKSVSDSNNSTSLSRVSRNIAHSSLSNRNLPGAPNASSSALYRKCYYFLWIALFLMVGGVTMIFFQLHFAHLNIEDGKKGISSLKNDFFQLFEHHNNDYVRKEPDPATINNRKPNQPNQIQPIEEKKETPLPPSTPKPVERESTSRPYDKSLFNEIHFVHIPKCGGTTMTAVLRQIQCNLDPIKNSDCCLNPGFCDWHAHRRCQSIKGCINHFPNRKMIYKPIPSFVVFREPISRILSAWFYRGHTPNNDFFQVRPYFKDIRDGKLPKVTFDEYIEMPEYQNIQTRMLGADSFPYRNITITEEIFQNALDAIDHFHFIALQEEFDLSARAFAREIVLNDSSIAITKEREQTSNKKIKDDKIALKNNQNLMARVREVNYYDIKLYEKAVSRFCHLMERYPDLLEEIKKNGKVHCP